VGGVITTKVIALCMAKVPAAVAEHYPEMTIDTENPEDSVEVATRVIRDKNDNVVQTPARHLTLTIHRGPFRKVVLVFGAREYWNPRNFSLLSLEITEPDPGFNGDVKKVIVV
jgi:hypothetical protein